MRNQKTYHRCLWVKRDNSQTADFVGIRRIQALVGIVLCLVLGVSGCKRVENENTAIRIETVSQESLDYPDADITVPDSLKSEFISNFFKPWNIAADAMANAAAALPGKEVVYLNDYLNDETWYGENKKAHKKWQREALVSNIDLASFPNFLNRGIVVRHTNLRRIPTNRPGFDRYSKAGEGFPFDYFQETNLWANTPLQLVHLSNDKQWCYVLSPYYKGWVQMHDIGLVDDDFIGQWMTQAYAMPLSDSLTLASPNSQYALNAKMGMVLPYEASEDTSRVRAFYVNTDENQYANLLKAELPKRHLAFDDLKLDRASLALLVSQFVERPYGWGGNLENRDCSSLIRDLLGTYKIWLPRDSKDQIELGQKIELTGSSEEKMQRIKENGIPFLTLLRKSGHNMLYVGTSENGEPLILHAIWGLKNVLHQCSIGRLY